MFAITALFFVMRMMLSKNFSIWEARCRHCHKLLVNEYLEAQVEAMQFIRNQWAGPIAVTSWYRCPCYNWHLVEIGYNASLSSPHMLSAATDFYPAGGDIDDLRRLFGLCESTGAFSYLYMAESKFFIHGDIRDLVGHR